MFFAQFDYGLVSFCRVQPLPRHFAAPDASCKSGVGVIRPSFLGSPLITNPTFPTCSEKVLTSSVYFNSLSKRK
jgi:hypothetical protein